MLNRALAALGVLLVIATASCTSGGGNEGGNNGSGAKVTITWWTLAEDVSGFEDKLISSFEAKYPNIHVELTTYPEAQFGTKVDTAVAAGAPPDIVQFPGLDLMKEGLLLPLDDMVKQQGIDLSTFNPAIVGTSGQENAEFGCAYGGHLYCLGSFTGSVQLLYNRDMFDAAGLPYPSTWPPMTVDQFVDTACKLTDSEHGVWGAAYGDPVTWLPWETFVSPDGRTATGYVNGPTSVHVYDVLAKGIENKCAPSLNVMDPWEQGSDFFAQGKLAMVVGGFQGLEQFEKAGIDYGVAGLPTPEGVEPFFNVWSDGLAIFAKTDHPAEAKLLVGYIGTEGQRLRAQLGDLPLDSKVAEQTNWTDDQPGRQEGLQVLQHSRAAIFIPNRWDTFGPIFDAFGFITSREKTAQQALSDATPAIQENLDKAWKIWDQT